MEITGLKILFFDIGNVFVCDDPSGCYVYHSLYERLRMQGTFGSPEDFFRARLEHLKTGGNLWSFAGNYVPQEEFRAFQLEVRRQMYDQWSALSPAIPGMAEAIRALAGHFRLGLIANQPRQVLDVLAERGLLDLFDVRGISEVCGMEKPNPEFFRWALGEAGVLPQDAMMIGDRADNDIGPAKSVGMRTMWLKLGSEGRGWKPQTHFERCYVQSAEDHYFSDRAPRGPQEEPDLIALSPRHMVELLLGSKSANALEAGAGG